MKGWKILVSIPVFLRRQISFNRLKNFNPISELKQNSAKNKTAIFGLKCIPVPLQCA